MTKLWFREYDSNEDAIVLSKITCIEAIVDHHPKKATFKICLGGDSVEILYNSYEKAKSDRSRLLIEMERANET